MNIASENDLLNIFRFVGHSVHWEDNATRALLSVVTRSQAGGQVLMELLLRCYSRSPADTPKPLRNRFRDALLELKQVEVRFQEVFSGEKRDADQQPDFAIVVALTPAESPPAVDRTTVSSNQGRFDAVLSCSTGSCTFDVVFEVKLYEQVGVEQFSRYVAHYGEDKCIGIGVPWSDVLDILTELPNRCQRDPLILDLADYLTDLHWLAGFRGFRKSDFLSGGANALRAHVRDLATELREGTRTLSDGIVGLHEIRGGSDFDFYLGDQFRLIGNTGLAAWDDGRSLAVKLVIGTFKFYGTDDDLTFIRARSGRATPVWESYWGLRHLLDQEPHSVAKWVTDLAAVVALDAVVFFRCYFNRFQDVSLMSREWRIGEGADWSQVDAALRMGEPQAGSMRVTQDSVKRLKEFLPPDTADLSIARVLDLLGTKQRTTPTHHAVLALSAKLPLDKLLPLSPPDQVDLVRHYHAPVAGLLRQLSGAK